MELLFRMLFSHVLGDFILTTEALSRYKNRNLDRPSGVPGWGYWLTAHAFLHGGLVYFATGSWLVAMYIFTMHWVIDYAKCDDKINANQDQILHLACILFPLSVGVL